MRRVSAAEAKKARDELRVLSIEKDILSSAVMTLFDSVRKGVLPEGERDSLASKYKEELKCLEEKMAVHQRVVGLYELESERERLMTNFQKRLEELNFKIKKYHEGKVSHSLEQEMLLRMDSSGGGNLPEMVDDSSRLQGAASDLEKRIESIREEVLKAMERLENIDRQQGPG